MKRSYLPVLIVLALLLSGARSESAKPRNLGVKQNHNQTSPQQQLTDTEQSIAKDLSSLAQTADAIHRDTVAANRQKAADQNSYSTPAMRVQICLAIVGLLYV